MRQSVTWSALLAALVLSGCGWHHESPDSVAREFGSDYFSAGGVLNVTELVEGDALLAGGQVSIVTEVHGDLLAAGGEVAIGGNIGDDVYAAGGTVNLDAIVSGNARIAGGDVTVGPATVIAGAASLNGGRVEFDGNTHQYLQVSAASVRLNGMVHGDAEIRAGDLEIGPETEVMGRLIYHGPEEPLVPEGAVIAQGIEFHESGSTLAFDAGRHEVRDAARGAGSVFWFLGIFLVAALFTGLFPEFSRRAAGQVGSAPLRSLGLGFAVLVCTPVLAVLLLITVIGIPLSLMLITAYLLLLLLGWLVTATYIGQKILAALRGRGPTTRAWRLLALLLALVVLWLLGRVPYVGDWIRFLALIVGMGALVMAAWSGRAPRPAQATA